MKCKLFLCSKNVSTDAGDNTVSIFSVLEQIQATTYPMFFGPLSIVSILDKEPGDAEKPLVELQIFSRKNKIFSHPVNVDFQGKKRCRAVVSLQGIVIPEAGDFKFSFRYKKKLLCEWVVEMELVAPDPKQNIFSMPLSSLSPQPSINTSSSKAGKGKKKK